jgi:hypothetical protein
MGPRSLKLEVDRELFERLRLGLRVAASAREPTNHVSRALVATWETDGMVPGMVGIDQRPRGMLRGYLSDWWRRDRPDDGIDRNG